MTCHSDILEGIIEYVSSERNRFSADDLNENALDALKNGLRDFYFELKPTEKSTIQTMFQNDQNSHSTIKFVSFNYTDVLDKCIEQVSKQPLKVWKHGSTEMHFTCDPEVIHVHGLTDHFAFLGVDDEKQVANKEFLKEPLFHDVMIKPKSITAAGEFWHQQAEQLINYSRIICVFGMSLGETDAKWWKLILNWLKGNSANHVILFWHTNNPVGKRNLFKYRSQEEKTRAKLLAFDDKNNPASDECRQRIHVVINTKMVLNVKLDYNQEQ